MGGLVGTLLGPEETGASLGASGLRDQVPVFLVGGVGFGGPGCFLRTAQWTRASLARMRSLCGIVFLSAICFDRFVCSSF